MKYLTILVLFVFCGAGCENSDSETVVFGFIPSSNIEEVEAVADSLCLALSNETGLKVKAFVAPDYASLIESVRTNHVQIAWFAPMSFVEAEQETKLFPMLTSVRGGKPFFYSGIFVRRDRNINSIEDLKGKVMGFSDPTSTAGRIFPETLIRSRGIKPESFFKQTIYLGGHDKVVQAVLDGLVDAGASFANDTINVDNAWHQFLKNASDIQKIKPIIYSKPIPGDVIACRNTLKEQSPEKVNVITEKLLKISTEDSGKRLIKKLNRTDALATTHMEDYESVREASKLVNVE